MGRQVSEAATLGGAALSLDEKNIKIDQGKKIIPAKKPSGHENQHIHDIKTQAFAVHKQFLKFVRIQM